MEARPFPILVRHFFGRFFDNESLSPQADAAANLGPLLAMLAVPSAFLAILLQSVTLVRWDLIYFRYFFLSFSMIAMAFIVVFKWDALFPDLRDYQILTPLPLRSSTLFLAKMTALALFLGLFLADINFFGVLFWPGIDRGKGTMSIFAAHAGAMLAGGLFAALAAATIQGVLMTVLRGHVFHRVAASIQTVLMTLLVMSLFVTPLLAMQVQQLVRAKSAILYWFPPFWFIGLYERLRPATGNQVLLDLGSIAILASWCAAAAFLLTYLPGYRRHARGALETPALSPAGPGRVRRFVEGALNRTALKRPVERAVFHFMTRTITRSMKHRLFLAAYGGFGLALGAFSLLSGPAGRLRLPLTLSFILISGLRAAFNFPSELRANWVFQLSETKSAGEYVAAMRKWMALYAVVPLFVLLSPLEFVTFTFWEALFHIAFGITLSLLLMEIMFFDFRKVAFACAYFPGRINLVGLSVIYVFGFTMYSDVMAAFESWLAGWPAAAVSFVAVAGVGLFLLGRARAQAGRGPLDYEAAGDPAVQTLGV